MMGFQLRAWLPMHGIIWDLHEGLPAVCLVAHLHDGLPAACLVSHAWNNLELHDGHWMPMPICVNKYDGHGK